MTIALFAALGLSLGLAACGGSSGQADPGAEPATDGTIVWGMGASDLYPIYEEFGSMLAGSGITLNYQLSGVGPALAQFRRTGGVAFVASAGSDPLGNFPRIGATSALYVPVAFQAVSVVYNLPIVHHTVRLNGKVLADIYRGLVHRWNDPEIARLNPGLRLPPLPIFVVHRSDVAPINALFTQYLVAHSPVWRRSYGGGEQVNWPQGGTPVSDDASMLQQVTQNVGAIGYIEQATAMQNDLQAAALENPSGAYMAPTLAATSAVGLEAHAPGDLSLTTVDAPVARAYPIAAEIYMLAYRDACQAGLDPSQAEAAQRFFEYALTGGQAVVQRLSYAPLALRLRISALAAVQRLLCGSQTIASL